MVNAAEFRSRGLVLLLAALVLTGAAWLRSAEYDEQYTLFLTAGTPRPDWPQTVFPAGAVAAVQAGHASLTGVARDLRATDVHPPFYFWAVSLWRTVFGPSLFAGRLLSVLCGLASLNLVGTIARRCAIPPALPMLLTLGCYGFVYTNAIARGFAPAQMLTLCGVALLFERRPLLAGACLGAACCCNYLAVFAAVAVIAGVGVWRAVPAAVPFLALGAWFFAAQHGSRTGQFPPFALWPSLTRLTEYQTAVLLGGLPLYADGIARIAIKVLVALTSAAIVVCIARARPLGKRRDIAGILAAALATPAGLLLLGVVFDNTPIELRYLSFGLPFIALLVAWAFQVRWGQTWLLPVILTLQLASIAGLLLSPRTMQPARATAIAAAHLVGDGIVLIPEGNDGVGIVGAFGIEASPNLPILVLGPADPIDERIGQYRRVVLTLLAQDRDSIRTIATLHAFFTAPNWRRVAIGSTIEVYERVETGG